MSELKVGDIAPGFELKDADDNLVKLSDYAGRRVVVYFYPAAMTPGCTIEAVDFSAARENFLEAGIDVVGISPDTPERLQKFIERKDLSVTLLSDPDHRAIEAYGVWGTKSLYGKQVAGVLRSTFIVQVNDDGVGKIDTVQRNVRANGHVERLGRALGLTLHLPEHD